MNAVHDVKAPRPIDRTDGEPTWFDKRVDALLALVTGQGKGPYDPELHKRAVEFYAEYEDPSRSYAESWLLAIRATLVEKGTLSEDEIDARLDAVRAKVGSKIMPDTIANFTRTFVARGNAPVDLIEQVEGQKLTKPVEVAVLMKSDTMLMLQVTRPKGMRDPTHQHDDHETSCHLVSGKLKLWIGGEEFIAVAGDTWFHPKGVPHWSEALEDCVQVEVKSPPVKTW
jgi:quercetin dioxygenase-like cupin family protein